MRLCYAGRREVWNTVRFGIAFLFAGIITAVTIPDYPYDWPLWESLCFDPNGYWHEVFYICVGLFVLLDLTYWWEHRRRAR